MQNARLYKRLILRLVLFAALTLTLVFVVPPLFSLFLPFLIAFFLGALLNKPINFVVKKVRVTRPFVSVITVLFVFLGLVALLSWFVYKLITEATSLAENIDVLTGFLTSSYDAIMKNLNMLLERLPVEAEETISQLNNDLLDWLQSVGKSIADNIISNTPNAAGRVGNVLLGVLIFLLSAFFLTNDYPKYVNRLKKYEKTAAYKTLNNLRENIKSAFGGFIKSLLILAVVCFVFMFAALTIYGQSYAFLLALLIAVMDFLPIVGSSAVLVPWAAVTFLSGDMFKAIFLLSLSVAFFIIRKMLEPKIMSSQIGLSPFVALCTTYIGLKLAGFIGFIFAPVLTIVIIRFVKTGIFDNTKKDLQDLIAIITAALRREGGAT